MERFFSIKFVDMSDGSGRLYSIETPEGERVASTTSEEAALRLRTLLNNTLDMWQRETGIDAVVNA